jgi:hypothetical protein
MRMRAGKLQKLARWRTRLQQLQGGCVFAGCGADVARLHEVVALHHQVLAPLQAGELVLLVGRHLDDPLRLVALHPRHVALPAHAVAVHGQQPAVICTRPSRGVAHAGSMSALPA